MRTASIICKSSVVLITIHRDEFQHMIAGSDANADAAADFVPISTGSIATRALRRILAIGGGTDCIAEADAVSPESPGTPETSGHTSPLKRQASASSLSDKRLPAPLKKTATLKDTFSASQMSRTDTSYNPDVAAMQRLLLERAAIARTTMRVWCDLRGLVPPAFVTIPIPEPLQELQVCALMRIVGSARPRLLASAGSPHGG